METMKIHVLERALTAACIIAAIAVVWWGFKILAAWLDGIGGFDHAGRSSATKRGRDAWFLPSSVNRFTQAWQKRLTLVRQTKKTQKSQNLIDADSELNHVSESSLQVTSFASA
jgi:hypothetical protein